MLPIQVGGDPAEDLRRIQPVARGLADGAMVGISPKISKVAGPVGEIRDFCVAIGLSMTIEDRWGGDIVTVALAHLAAERRLSFCSRRTPSTAT